jgi:hypothetical protein
MTLDALIMFAGAFVALLPFLGFPTSWDTAILFILGIFIVALGIVVRRRGLGLPEEERRAKFAQQQEASE